MKGTVRILINNSKQLPFLKEFKLENEAGLNKGVKVAWQDFNSLEEARKHLIDIAFKYYKKDSRLIDEYFGHNTLTIGLCVAQILRAEEREEFLTSFITTYTLRYDSYLVEKGYCVFDRKKMSAAEGYEELRGTKSAIQKICKELNKQ